MINILSTKSPMRIVSWLLLCTACTGADAFARDEGLPAVARRDASPRAPRDAAAPPQEDDPGMLAPVLEPVLPDAPETSVEEPPSDLTGSALREGCSSYGARDGDRCAGFYCATSEPELARALQSSVCSSFSARMLCDGELGRAANRCARQVVASHLLQSVAQLHPELIDCIAEAVPEFASAPPDCQACTLGGIECGSEHCAIACAAGDGPGCDACRIEQGCNGDAYDCGELPNPL